MRQQHISALTAYKMKIEMIRMVTTTPTTTAMAISISGDKCSAKEGTKKYVKVSIFLIVSVVAIWFSYSVRCLHAFRIAMCIKLGTQKIQIFQKKGTFDCTFVIIGTLNIKSNFRKLKKFAAEGLSIWIQVQCNEQPLWWLLGVVQKHAKAKKNTFLF